MTSSTEPCSSNSTKAPGRDHGPTKEVVSLTIWGQASVLFLLLQAGTPPPVLGMTEYYTQIIRILNLAHTIALQRHIHARRGPIARILQSHRYALEGGQRNGESTSPRGGPRMAELTGVTGATVQATEILKTGVEKGEGRGCSWVGMVSWRTSSIGCLGDT